MLPALVLAVALTYPPPSTQGLRRPTGSCDRCGLAIPRRLRRPMHLPTLPPGSPCPVSARHDLSPNFGAGLGPGPVYPVGFDAESTLRVAGPPGFPHPWLGQKVLWAAAPSYRGPILIRGHELDGPWWMGFEGGVRPLSELRLPRGSGWRGFPSFTRVREAGCYGYQVDGTTFSRVVVFRAAAP